MQNESAPKNVICIQLYEEVYSEQSHTKQANLKKYEKISFEIYDENLDGKSAYALHTSYNGIYRKHKLMCSYV